MIAKRGDIDAGLRALRGGFELAGEAIFLPRFLLLLGEFAAFLGKTGESGLALETIEEALARCKARDERWYLAELLRIKGELMLLQNAVDAPAVAEEYFLEALDCAHRQYALSWELRTATSLAQLWRDRYRAAEARELLHPVYNRFTEGFDTADLKSARVLLDTLR